MIRKSQSNAAVPSLIALVAVLVLVCPAAHAQVKPFKITGAGIGPHGLPLPGQPPRPHWAIGDATHLGRYYGEGSVQTLTASPDGEGGFTGTFQSGVPFMFVAANGDVLACDYGRDGDDPGTFTLTPVGDGTFVAHWVAEFVPVPAQCTGRFAGVTGGWKMYAVSEPLVPGLDQPLAYSWRGEGSLTFPRKK
jgi:hypothetical protein